MQGGKEKAFRKLVREMLLQIWAEQLPRFIFSTPGCYSNEFEPKTHRLWSSLMLGHNHYPNESDRQHYVRNYVGEFLIFVEN